MDESRVPDVSIVVPLYNEEENVLPLIDAIGSALEGWDRPYEVLLVDDGSSDLTVPRALERMKREPTVRLLRLKRNAGQTQAMAVGFARSRGEIIVSMDGDLQNDPRDIPFLVERLETGFDVVCGWRKARQDAFINRKLPSMIANRLLAWVTGINIHDNGCSLKAYRASVIQSVRLYSDMHRFLPALSSMTGARIDEVVVRHHPRIHGESKYGISRTFKVLADMIVIKMLTQFANRPGLWFATLAIPFLLVGLLTGTLWWGGRWVDTSGEPSIVAPSLAAMFLYLYGYLMTLSLLSELLLARADRRGLTRLATVLANTESLNPRSQA